MNDRTIPRGTGRTYSLYGGEPSSDGYYALVRELTDDLLAQDLNVQDFLPRIQRAASSRTLLRKLLRERADHSPVRHALNRIQGPLSRTITGLEDHLASLSFAQRFDRVLSLTEEQYILAMLEVELVNRIYKEPFSRLTYRIALLPHCLRDLSQSCQSAMADIDYVCRRCSSDCFIHRASDILAHNRIKAYIWMSADVRRLFRKLKRQHTEFGVLGIACIPELARGMRMCTKHGVPVVGIPLDANRCARWMGEFHPNSVNLEELSRLVQG